MKQFAKYCIAGVIGSLLGVLLFQLGRAVIVAVQLAIARPQTAVVMLLIIIALPILGWIILTTLKRLSS